MSSFGINPRDIAASMTTLLIIAELTTTNIRRYIDLSARHLEIEHLLTRTTSFWVLKNNLLNNFLNLNGKGYLDVSWHRHLQVVRHLAFGRTVKEDFMDIRITPFERLVMSPSGLLLLICGISVFRTVWD
jgi:hypothetical protein